MQEYKNRVRKHFLYCKKLLQLPKNWKIEIEIDNTLTEYANVQWRYPYNIFKIFINESMNKDDATIIDTIIHELLHILFSPTTSKIERLIAAVKNKSKINPTNTQKKFDRLEEGLVCHLTKVILQPKKGCK